MEMNVAVVIASHGRSVGVLECVFAWRDPSGSACSVYRQRSGLWALKPPLPFLITFFCNYVALMGELDAFNHLSYQLCAKQQPH